MTLLLNTSVLINADPEFIKNLKQKNIHTFEELFDQYAGPLCSMIENVTKCPSMTSELMVKVFTRAYKNILQFDENKSTIYVWMLGIARMVALEAKKQHDDDIRKEHFMSGNFGQINGLRQLIDQLPESCRTILSLNYFEGMNTAAIARHLMKTEDEVRQCRNKGLNLLAKILGWANSYELA